jgi:hypothetical protein
VYWTRALNRAVGRAYIREAVPTRAFAEVR